MAINEAIKVLDHGYVRLVESWGGGDAGVPEAGIIEAARQSTQGAFRDWHPYKACESCGAWITRSDQNKADLIQGTNVPLGGYCPGESDHQWKEYPRGDEGLLQYLFNSNPPHSTPFEFAGCIIEVQCPIFVIREWHRHRTQWYNEMSARYSPLPNMNYMPTYDRLFLTDAKNKQAQAVDGSLELTPENAMKFLDLLDKFYDSAEQLYQGALEAGIPKEVARICLPVGRYTKMRAGANLRNWLAFMTLRYHPKAQWEIQQFSGALGQILEQEFPRVWKLFSTRRAKEL